MQATANGDLNVGSATCAAVWLRDNCSCPNCRDGKTGQKLFDITDLPKGVTIVGIDESAESVAVVFGPDGHRSTYGPF